MAPCEAGMCREIGRCKFDMLVKTGEDDTPLPQAATASLYARWHFRGRSSHLASVLRYIGISISGDVLCQHCRRGLLLSLSPHLSFMF